jgi:hypothetical protein
MRNRQIPWTLIFLFCIPLARINARTSAAVPAAQIADCQSEEQDQSKILRRLAADMAKTRTKALAKAREVIRSEIEAATQDNKPSKPHRMRVETAEAIAVIAAARDADSVSLLIAAIDFVAPVEPPGKSLGRVGTDPPTYRVFPASAALVVIGAPASRPLVEALARQTAEAAPGSPRRQRSQLQWTLAAIAGPELAVRLFDHAIATSANESDRKNLIAARDEFRSVGRIVQLTQHREYQLFEGSVREHVR